MWCGSYVHREWVSNQYSLGPALSCVCGSKSCSSHFEPSYWSVHPFGECEMLSHSKFHYQMSFQGTHLASQGLTRPHSMLCHFPWNTTFGWIIVLLYRLHKHIQWLWWAHGCRPLFSVHPSVQYWSVPLSSLQHLIDTLSHPDCVYFNYLYCIMPSNVLYNSVTVGLFSAPAWHFSWPVVHFAFKSGCRARKRRTHASPISTPEIALACAATTEWCSGTLRRPIFLIHLTNASSQAGESLCSFSWAAVFVWLPWNLSVSVVFETP